MPQDIISELKNEGVLKGYWDFRSGTTRDFSGNGNHATITGTVGMSKEGLVCPKATATSNGCTLPNLGVSGAQARTLYIRFKPSFPQQTNNYGVLFCYGEATNTKQFSVLINTTYYYCGVAAYGNDKYSSNNTLTNDKMMSYTAVYNGTTSLSHYINGLFDSTDAVTAYDTTEQYHTIGHRSNSIAAGEQTPFWGTIESIVFCNRVLTATEIAQLESQIVNTKWPNKITSKSKADTQISLNESDLVGSYNMKLLDGTLIDNSGNGYNSTSVTGSPSHCQTLIGDALYFSGSDYIDFGDVYGFDGQVDFTVELMFKKNTKDTTLMICDKRDNNDDGWRISIAGNDEIYVSINDKDTTDGFSFEDTNWHHLVIRVVGNDTVYVYLDGSLYASESISGESLSTTSTFRIGAYSYDGSNGFVGWLANFNIYDVAKDVNWIEQRYNHIKNTLVNFKTDWGATESPAVEGGTIGAYLSNTPFQFADTTGRFKISTDTINGETVKVIECTTAGTLYLPYNLFADNTTEAHAGTFNFWWNKADAGNLDFNFGSQATTWSVSGFNGYVVRLGSAENYQHYRIANGSASGGTIFSSASSYYNHSTWYNLKLTVTSAGVRSVYQDDILVTANTGANPGTNTTYSTINYLTFAMGAGHKIAYSDKKGEHSIIKRSLP